MKNLLYPPILHWEVTPECNHNCIHCYNYWRKESEHKSFHTCDHFEIAKEIINRHPVTVVVTGGEQLLVFSSLKNSLKLLNANHINISINTNAALVTEEIAKFLSDIKATAFVSLPCAIPSICDAITNVPNSLSNISAGIKTLVKYGVKVSVNMVVSKRNLAYIYETGKYAKEVLGLSSFFASRVSKPINSDNEFTKDLLTREDALFMYTELLQISNDFGIVTSTASPTPACIFSDDESFQKFACGKACTAGRTSYSIDCSGNVKACVRDIQTYGNILSDNFSDIWARMIDWRNDEFLPIECNNCNAKSLCRGACRLDAFPKTGKRNSLDPIANLNNLPVKFAKHTNNKKHNPNQLFCIPKNISFINEDFSWRANVGTKFIFITTELKDFLSVCTKFCINDFMQKYNVDYSLANDVVNLLLDSGIIYMHE